MRRCINFYFFCWYVLNSVDPYVDYTLNLEFIMVTKDKPNKVTATLKVVITGEFYDDEVSEETLRYCAEQALENEGFDVEVSVVRNNRFYF